MRYYDTVHVISRPDSYWRAMAKNCPNAWWAKKYITSDKVANRKSSHKSHEINHQSQEKDSLG